MIDFKTIIGGLSGQRDSFEELVCQIARRCPPPNAAEYRRIHGAGGDGGLEAVWVLTNGDEVGYQAKFYTTSREVDWVAVDGSVEAALATHPKLTRMFVAIACVMTGQTARRTTRGRPQTSGWDQWENHKKRWMDSARALGRSVEFVPWTTAELSDMLTLPVMVGKLDYWFGAIELPPSRLEGWCSRAVDALEERYHPEDHVNVATREIFDGLQKNEMYLAKLRAAREKLVEKARIASTPCKMPDPARADIEVIRQEAESLLTTMQMVDKRAQPIPYADWRTALLHMRSSVFKGIQHADTLNDQRKGEEHGSLPQQSQEEARETASAQYLVNSLRRLQDALGDFIEMIDAGPCQCDASRFAFLDGRAGSGKSHLIASEIERSLKAGAPAVFLLGTDFSPHQTAEAQILARLEIDGLDFGRFLGALSAKAEAAQLRGLIAIDAINEGAGAALWRSALLPFAQRVLAHGNLSLCISYRSEYGPFLITDGAKALATVVEVKGFDTPEEIQEAARVYMDRRGIIRPSSPRLDPEFSNPLFLRTACLALERDGRSEFPRGMRGTSEVLNFFLTSTARHLGTAYDGSDVLAGSTKRALLGLARRMAADRRDFVERSIAFQIIGDCYSGFSPPVGKTWLEQLRFCGLLRLDPHPDLDLSNPLAIEEDVVRFSFQRFQDHLIALSLLEGSDAPGALFRPAGKLAFMLDEDCIVWSWRGVFYAACVVIAEKSGVEVVDALPGGFETWWHEWGVQDAFIESIRWRSAHAFSARTLELLNKLGWDRSETISLLLELAVLEGHPWNAEFLHRNLKKRKLAPRDAFWTQPINEAEGDGSHPLWRLIDWCLGDGTHRAHDDILALAAKILAWAASSTSWAIRDRSTKGLAAVLLARPALAAGLLQSFEGCDDPYVVERILAALMGASLRSPVSSTLGHFSQVVWEHCFKGGEPPVHFLARDYARGVIELAAEAGQLAPHIDIDRCRPPYASKAPVFNLSEARVTARSDRLGAGSIIGSCYRGLADFGRYTLESPVQSFAAARLSGPRPQTSEERYDRFRSEIIDACPERITALEALQTAHLEPKFTFDPEENWTGYVLEENEQAREMQAHLDNLLTPEEQVRFRSEALPRVRNRYDNSWVIPSTGKDTTINARQAKLWVANRAMSLGWTEKLFPYDRGRGDRDMQAGRVERIGKKYQRIALMELLARLADNFWLKPDWGTKARVYDNPTEVSYMRDLEVSVFPRDEKDVLTDMPAIPALQCPGLSDEQREAWVNDPTLAADRLQFALGSDLASDEWVAMYRHSGHHIASDTGGWSTFWKENDFYFLTLFFMENDERNRFLAETEAHQDDVHEWLPHNVTDGPFLGELGRRSTWKADQWEIIDCRGGDPRSYKAIIPAINYQWESHLDSSLQNGFRRHVPIPWLLGVLELSPDVQRLGVFLDVGGIPTIWSSSTEEGSHLFIRRDALAEIEKRTGLVAVWTIIGERQAYSKPGGATRASGPRVRYNGTMILQQAKPQIRTWSRSD